MTKSYVTITNKVCPICGKTHDFNCELLIHKQLKEVFDTTTVVGWGYCEECTKFIEEDRVALIGAKEPESGNTLTPESADRTGEVLWIRREAAKQILKEVEDNVPFLFISQEGINAIKTMAGG